MNLYVSPLNIVLIVKDAKSTMHSLIGILSSFTFHPKLLTI